MASTEPTWETRYSRKLFWTDVGVVTVVTICAQLIAAALSGLPYETTPISPHFVSQDVAFTIILALIWLACLTIYNSRSPEIFGTGPEEYKNTINATILAFGIVAIVLVFVSPTALQRLTIIMGFPSGVLLLVTGRWAWRKRLHQQRRRNRNMYRTLIVGDQAHSKQIVKQLRRNRLSGFDLIGAVAADGVGEELLPGLPIIADFDNIIPAVQTKEIDAIVVTSSNVLTPVRMRQLGWELEGQHVDLIVAASLTDIAGPRIHMRPVSGLPLIHVEFPEFSGWRYYAKSIFDLVVTLLLLIPSSLIMVALAIAVRISSEGPVLFKQSRLGHNGKPFTMYKFRTMFNDAEEQLPGLLDQSDSPNKVLFKLEHDPRVTRVGRFMRRHSLDELPQLFNVLKGEMSLVGPRPPLPHEAEKYEKYENRRLLVLPGMSGLWQVSGRSDLSWEESVRLDLYYVENWSMTGDLLILWRTIRTVVKPKGAY